VFVRGCAASADCAAAVCGAPPCGCGCDGRYLFLYQSLFLILILIFLFALAQEAGKIRENRKKINK